MAGRTSGTRGHVFITFWLILTSTLFQSRAEGEDYAHHIGLSLLLFLVVLPKILCFSVSKNLRQETFSCPKSCSCRPAIFVHGRNDESTIFFDQWKLSKQTSYWFKTGFSFSVKNHNKFSSQNFRHYVHVRKSPDDMNKFHNYFNFKLLS